MDYAGLKFPSEKQLNKIRACMEELHIRSATSGISKKLCSFERHMAEIVKSIFYGM